MENQHTFGIVLLAAGSSARLGMPKQLLRYKGSSLLRHATREAVATKPNAMLVVLGAKASVMQEEMNVLGVDTVLNKGYEEGIASSIRCGLQHIGKENEYLQSIIFMVCDQPYVDTAHLQTLIDTYRMTGAPIVASDYAGISGVPVLFDKSLFPELMLLKGDVGARRIIHKHQGETIGVPFPLGVVDVDTMEAYGALNKNQG